MSIFSKIGITSDHAGQEVQKFLLAKLANQTLSLKEYSPQGEKGVSLDYPDCVGTLAKDLSLGHVDAAIAVCGTGIGMAIVANKHKGVRAASLWNETVARLSRQHNDSNFLCLGARELSLDEALAVTKAWLTTSFEAGRHQRRIDKLNTIEEKNFKD